MAKQV
ncbi:Protein of unknown function [Bacillus cereus]